MGVNVSAETSQLGAPEDFGAYLVDHSLLSETALSRVWEILVEARQGLAGTLVGLGLLSEENLAQAFCDHYGLERASEDDWPLEPLEFANLNVTFLSDFHIVPIRECGDVIEAALADPSNDYIVKALSFACGKSVRGKVATLSQVEKAINQLYYGADEHQRDADTDGLADDVDRLKELAADAPVIRFVDRLIDEALLKGASDIHVEPQSGLLLIRLRVDGMLVDMAGPSRDMSAAVVSRIKIMSGLDIGERRLPQDGRMRLRAHGKQVDFRVSTSPTEQGEAVVLRLLDRSNVALDFSKLGFDKTLLRPFRDALGRPDGIVLVTGPTGSGKTTTLYTGLSELNVSSRKILTVEDPVEYVIEGLGQVQVDPRISRTFATTLRSFLRQDPDIIMVGEIRDEETAAIAVQASLTGHLVLSTLHTNSAAAAVARLTDMGVEPYLITSTLRLVVAQRLVRILCDACKRVELQTQDFLADFGLAPADAHFFEARGCEACHGTGYRGRTVIAETLQLSPVLEKAILAGKTTSELEAVARQEGMRTLFEHGRELILAGKTSISEILRVTRETG